MAVRNVVRMGHPTLRQVAEPYPIGEIGSADFLELVGDMRETLHAYGGIGLAAPQIDVGYQLAVIEIENAMTRYGEVETIPFSVFINPVVTVISPDPAGYWEGCLSVPGMMGFVERPQHIEISYLDESGLACKRQLTGFLATVFQHEFDHLQGRLYVDRLKDPSLFAFEDEYRAYHLTEDVSEPARNNE